MTNLAILFLVLFVISLIIAIIAVINAIKIDIKHAESEMQLLSEVMWANKERLKLLLEIEKLKEGKNNE